MGKETQDLSFTLSNSIVKTKYNLSLATQKLLFFLITKIGYEEKMIGNVSNDKNDIVPFEKRKFLKDIEVPLSEMKEFIKSTGRENSNDITEVLDKSILELGKNNIRWTTIDEKNKKIKNEYSWFSKSIISEKSATFTFRFNDAIAEYLLHQSNFFTSYLKEFVKLSSLNAINLYMLFRANHFSKKIQIYYIEELKEYLGVEINYSRWGDFKDKVIDPSMVQLNAETNYLFFYEAKRIGRSIGRIEFRTFNKEEDKKAISDFFTEKIQELLKKEKVEKSAIENMALIHYEYDTKKNCINVSFKDESSADTFRKSVAMRNKTNREIIKEVVYPTLKESKECNRFLKTFFKEGVILEFVERKKKQEPKPIEPTKKTDEIVLDPRDAKEKYITKIMLYGLSKNQAELIAEREKEEDFDAVILDMSEKIRAGKLKISDSLGYLERILKL
ncbi:replication initiation protein [Elizabethkingia ursingii]